MPRRPPSPLGEAIERMGEAARDFIDGPVASLRTAADHAASAQYNANTAAADAAGLYLQLARAWWGGVNATLDATAILALPPGDYERFEVPIPEVPALSTVRIVKTRWTWLLGPEPADVAIDLQPPTRLSAGTKSVRFRVTGSFQEPQWEVELEITPLDGSAPRRFLVQLDAGTELPPDAP